MQCTNKNERFRTVIAHCEYKFHRNQLISAARFVSHAVLLYKQTAAIALLPLNATFSDSGGLLVIIPLSYFKRLGLVQHLALDVGV